MKTQKRPAGNGANPEDQAGGRSSVSLAPDDDDRSSVATDTMFQPMPDLSSDQLAALKVDIIKNGIIMPVVVDQHGRVIDGHNRRRIADELGIPCPTETHHVADDEEAHELALTLNCARRHLTREQIRVLIGTEIARRPGDSDRAIARRIGCDHKTVGSVRGGEIPHLSKLDSDDEAQIPTDAELGAHFAEMIDGSLPARRGPDTVVGIDPSPKPKPKPRRASFPDAYRYAVDDLDKVVRRIERLHADDRFLGHREDLQQRRGDLLTEIASVVSGIESDLGGYLKCPNCEQRVVPDRFWGELLCTACRQIGGGR